MMVETINVARDEKEARARAKAAARHKRTSTHSSGAGEATRKQTASSVRSFNAALAVPLPNSAGPELPSSSSPASPAPWLLDQRRRFSSPLLSNKMQNLSVDNLGRTAQYADSSAFDLRASTHSMMTPNSTRAGYRSPSPSSRQSFALPTHTPSPRNSRGWRKSFWNRSASASVASFGHTGSMMEMHLGMSQDKHHAANTIQQQQSHQQPQYYNDGSPMMPGNAPSSAVWPDSASAMDEAGGISPDDNVEAATSTKKKKKGFKKFFNTLLGGGGDGHSGGPISTSRSGNHRGGGPASVANSLDSQRPDSQKRRESALDYAATTGYNDDYSEPLAPPPPLSFLTGQQPHRRSVSTSSQSSASPVMGPAEHLPAHLPQQARPNALSVPNRDANSSGFVSPSTSSSDLNRPRPSSVTSWRSSSNKTGSPQSPREYVAESFSSSMPPIQQDLSEDKTPPGLAGTMQLNRLGAGDEARGTGQTWISDNANENPRLKKEKSLPALPPADLEDAPSPPVLRGPALASSPQSYFPPQMQTHLPSHDPWIAPSGRFPYSHAPQRYPHGDQRNDGGVSQSNGWGPPYPSEYNNAQQRQTHKEDQVERKDLKTKSKSKLFGFRSHGSSASGNNKKKDRRPSSPITPEANMNGAPPPGILSSSIGDEPYQQQQQPQAPHYHHLQHQYHMQNPYPHHDQHRYMQHQQNNLQTHQFPTSTSAYCIKNFVPHETALEAVVRDNPGELVAYR